MREIIETMPCAQSHRAVFSGDSRQWFHFCFRSDPCSVRIPGWWREDIEAQTHQVMKNLDRNSGGGGKRAGQGCQDDGLSVKP